MAALAEDLGLSKSTVSRALHDSRQVSKKTIARVKQRAKELGYEVHPHLRTLMSQKRRKLGNRGLEIIAYVNDYDAMEEFDKFPLSRRIFLNAEEQASEMGCMLEWIPLRKSDHGGEKLRRELVARGVLGLILGPTHKIGVSPPKWMDAFALVSCGSYWKSKNIDCVRTDGRDSYLRLISALEKRGCRKVGTCFPSRMRRPFGGLGSIFQNLHSWGEVSLRDLGESLPPHDVLLMQIEAMRIDGLIFHGAQNAQEVGEFLDCHPNELVVAEYSPRDIDGIPRWLKTASPLEQIGRTLSKIVIEKIIRSEWGPTACPQSVVFPSTLRACGGFDLDDQTELI